MKSGKYKYFAGGLIAGKSGELLKLIMKQPNIKKSFNTLKEMNKESYNKVLVRGKTPPKGLDKLDLKRNKALLLQDVATGYAKKVLSEAQKQNIKVLSNKATKNSPERLIVARSAKLVKNLNRYKKSLNQKGSALLERYKNKYKNN